MKYKRHSKILELIEKNNINTQEELTALLNQAGYKVTQATVSRDIKEMGLIKTPDKELGYKYAPNHETPIQEKNKHMQSFAMAVISVESALHTVVVKTYPGTAQGVAALIDSIFAGQMLGSIAGDDTILIITQNEKTAVAFADKLKKIY